MAKLRSDSWRRDVRPGVFVLVFALIVFLLVALLAGLIFSPALSAADASLSAAVRALRNPALTDAMRLLTRLGDGIAIATITILAAVVLFATGRRPEALFVVLTVGIGWAIGSLIQLAVARARPVGVALIPLPDQFSFPSGHTLASTLLFGALSFIVLGEVRRPWLRYALVALFGALAVGIGLSRVYLGVHWVGDVVAGWLLGGAVLLVAVLGFFALTTPREA